MEHLEWYDKKEHLQCLLQQDFPKHSKFHLQMKAWLCPHF